MRTEQDIFNDAGELLLSISPPNASKIIANVALEPEDDSGEFTYAYIDKTENQHCLRKTDNVSEKLFDLMIELRKYHVQNFKSKEKSFWHSCIVTVDVEKSKIHFDFSYEQDYFKDDEDDYNDKEDWKYSTPVTEEK